MEVEVRGGGCFLSGFLSSAFTFRQKNTFFRKNKFADFKRNFTPLQTLIKRFKKTV